MIFLGEIVAISQHSATARVVVGARGFSPKTAWGKKTAGEEICASIALEYLAQTAALTGQRAKHGEQQKKDGYLVSVRTFESTMSSFTPGTPLTATASLASAGESLQTFEGVITDDRSRETVVKATFSIFSFSATEHA
jgi:predicted hotdog family 3-hydroxylacyl-ACP dehydratase